MELLDYGTDLLLQVGSHFDLIDRWLENLAPTLTDRTWVDILRASVLVAELLKTVLVKGFCKVAF